MRCKTMNRKEGFDQLARQHNSPQIHLSKGPIVPVKHRMLIGLPQSNSSEASMGDGYRETC